MFKKKVFILTAFTLISLIAFAAKAVACSCVGSTIGILPCQEYWAAAAVFTGQVTDIALVPIEGPKELNGYSHKRVRILLEESFRGVSGAEVEIMTGMGGGDCGYGFKQGERYFVYAYRNQADNKLYAGICGRTVPLAKAGNDLEYARAIANGRPGASIFGILLRYTYDAQRDLGKESGIVGAPILIEGNNKTYNLTSDDEGRFHLGGLSDGVYRVSVALAGNLRKLPAKEVTVARDKCGAVEFYTTSLGTLKGKLFEANGSPASQIELRLVPLNANGDESSEQGRVVVGYSDEQGVYSFERIPSGKYAIVVNPEEQPRQDVPPFPRTYFPGTSDFAKAVSFHIAEEQEVEAPDFRLPSRLVERTIVGTARLANGQPAVGAMISLESSDLRTAGPHAFADQAGRFALRCYEGYRYTILANHMKDKDWMHADPIEFLGAAENEPIDLVIDKPGNSLRIRAEKRREKKP
jgi:hypothetical protein